MEATKARHPNQVFLSPKLSPKNFHQRPFTKKLSPKLKHNTPITFTHILLSFDYQQRNADLKSFQKVLILKKCSNPAQRRWKGGRPEIVLLWSAAGDFVVQLDLEIVARWNADQSNQSINQSMEWRRLTNISFAGCQGGGGNQSIGNLTQF